MATSRSNMSTKEATDRSYAVLVKDVNTGRISRVAFPEDVQVGLASDPRELMLTGRLSLSSMIHEVDTRTPVTVGTSCTLALIKPASGVLSGTLNVVLPKNPRQGQLVFVKDDAGTAGVINIRITSADGTSLIDGTTSKIISTSFGSMSLSWHLGAWHLYAQYNSRPLYGQFTDTTTQSATLANTAYYMSFNTIDFSNGISITNDSMGSPTRVTVAEDGIYQMSISPQLYQTGAKKTISIWLVKNREHGGAAIENTCSDVDIGFGGSDSALPMIPVLVELLAGDYVEWAWSSNGTGSQLLYTAPRVSPTRPADPSIILVVKRISPKS